MSNADKKTLIRLGGATNVRIDPSQDFRGRRVIDINGEDLGDVRDLYVDPVENKPRLLVLAVGGFIGLGRMKFALPSETILRVRDHAIHIDRERDHVMASAAYEPELVNRDYVSALYRYYRLAPYWTDGTDGEPGPGDSHFA
jgi:sporulation protein YlmC with PRC-barrel domain